jgi:hypothetical protein
MGGTCGSASSFVSLRSTENATGRTIDTDALSNEIRVAGQAASLTIVATPAATEVRGTVVVKVTAWDSGCGNPVPGVPVTLTVVSPMGEVVPTGGITDNSGSITASLRTSPAPGANIVRADAPGATSATAYVDGTAPAEAKPYLSKNFFDPGRNEKVKVSLLQAAAQRVSVRVYNIAGELVRKVGDGDVPAGMTFWEWDGRNASNELVGNGVYFIQVVRGKETDIKRVIVLKR